MVSGTTVQVTTISEFWNIARREETFFWHFIQKGQCDATVHIKPLSDLDGRKCYSPLDEIANEFGLTIYESYVEDAINFLVDLGYQTSVLYNPKCKCHGPKFVGFRKGKIIAGTAFPNICYCTEGIVEVIYLTNPSLFEKSLLGVEKEDLE